jgi:UDP-3-O-[3-hydroxymyristoyl] glucosamine N-acyltransferase
MQEGKHAYRLAEIVQRFGGELLGDPEAVITQVATLETAGPGQISFFSNPKYRRQLEQTRAEAVILTPNVADATQRSRIVCNDPYAYFARLSALLNPLAAVIPGAHPSAQIDPSARVSPSASIGACVAIGPHCEIGEGTLIEPGSVLGAGVRIGRESRLYANVTVYHDCLIGERVIIHSGVVIGADGFGIAWENGRWNKIPQIGRVVVGDDVEIGANTTIDRGALADTVIEEGVKLDNQIQIGHNCHIGAHTAIAGCAGVAGSTRIGRHCRIGGGAMIGGHLELVDGVEISGGTSVPKSILKPGTYTSVYPMSPHRDWLKNASHLRHLDEVITRVRSLERQLAELQGNKK